ncbi:MAG: hypothetical protein AAF958_11905 [Planctomycetota bacterium]
MNTTYFVRVGAMAEIYQASGPAGLRRGTGVLVRSGRGVQRAEVLADDGEASASAPSRAGDVVQILRPVSRNDGLLMTRLERHRREAIEAAREAMANHRCAAMLLDVDVVLDGGTLIMHFAGNVDQITQSAIDEIVARYESVVRLDELAQKIQYGCGPACGTEVCATQARGDSGADSDTQSACASCGMCGIKGRS